MPEFGRLDRMSREARHVGEAYSRHRLGASAAMRTRRSGTEQGRKHRSSAYFQHFSLLIAQGQRRMIAADLVKMIFDDYPEAIDGPMQRPGQEP
jgi:hypothetical protein